MPTLDYYSLDLSTHPPPSPSHPDYPLTIPIFTIHWKGEYTWGEGRVQTVKDVQRVGRLMARGIDRLHGGRGIDADGQGRGDVQIVYYAEWISGHRLMERIAREFGSVRVIDAGKNRGDYYMAIGIDTEETLDPLDRYRYFNLAVCMYGAICTQYPPLKESQPTYRRLSAFIRRNLRPTILPLTARTLPLFKTLPTALLYPYTTPPKFTLSPGPFTVFTHPHPLPADILPVEVESDRLYAIVRKKGRYDRVYVLEKDGELEDEDVVGFGMDAKYDMAKRVIKEEIIPPGTSNLQGVTALTSTTIETQLFSDPTRIHVLHIHTTSTAPLGALSTLWLALSPRGVHISSFNADMNEHNNILPKYTGNIIVFAPATEGRLGIIGRVRADGDNAVQQVREIVLRALRVAEGSNGLGVVPEVPESDL